MYSHTAYSEVNHLPIEIQYACALQHLVPSLHNLCP